MAFCGNCGFEVPEGMKYCPYCGTAVYDPNNSTPVSKDNTDTIDSLIEDWQPRSHGESQMETSTMEIEEDRVKSDRKKVKSKRSIPWMIVAIVSLIMGVGSWFIPSDVVTWIDLAIALVMGIVSLCMKARLRAISIISIVVSGILIILWIMQGILYLRDPHDPREVSYGRLSITIPAKYLADVDNSYDQDTYSTRDGNATIMIAQIDRCFSEGQLYSFSGTINDVLKDAFATKIIVTDSGAAQYREVAGLKSLTFQYTGLVKGRDLICNAVFINDPGSQQSVILAQLYMSENKDKYGNDFEELLNNIKIGTSISSPGSKSSGSSSGDSVFSTVGVDRQLKAALDEYEAFVDEYVSFMKKYQADPNNAIGMISDYTSMLTRLAEFSEKINGYDTGKMSKADYAYYLEVITRVEKKMLEVAY